MLANEDGLQPLKYLTNHSRPLWPPPAQVAFHALAACLLRSLRRLLTRWSTSLPPPTPHLLPPFLAGNSDLAPAVS